MKNDDPSFEQRKKDHLVHALDSVNQSTSRSGFELISLVHEALPELNFDDVRIGRESFGRKLGSPNFVSSMTAGHVEGVDLNCRLAKACQKHGWMMGVGSQRKQLFDSEARKEWALVREKAPDAVLIGNIGLSQLVETPMEKIRELVDSLQASAIFVHLNALQEVMQPEGTPSFSGGLDAISSACSKLSVPVIVKETGCGFSKATLKKLSESGVYAVDVAGLGGTHWGRVEGARSSSDELLSQAALTFGDWGISTLESLLNAVSFRKNFRSWCSGGMASGLDSAKALALGADFVGFAGEIMKAAMSGEEALDQKMRLLDYELRVALFCTGSRNLNELSKAPISSRDPLIQSQVGELKEEFLLSQNPGATVNSPYEWNDELEEKLNREMYGRNLYIEDIKDLASGDFEENSSVKNRGDNDS